ncbi:MAG: putative O-methyltransferase [Rhodobacteraceae bacterium HLUCCA08]|nr:MAG: putative O-methyltransferase [Rhodobacteraceae bacterium HLUCCA08]
MDFSDIKINLDIPRTMTLDGLRYLGALARTVPEGGTIVEIGPLYGSSTWVLSKNAHPSVRIVSIDTWEPQDWIPRRLPEAPAFGLDAFRAFVADCPNVEPIQGFSPACVQGWSDRVDLIFDDATHGDPGFSENINFFLPHLREGGIVCGDDFASGWPDIIRVVKKLATDWGTWPEVAGRVWAINKFGAKSGHDTVYERLPGRTGGDLYLEAEMASGTRIATPPNVWCGALHGNDTILALGARRADGTDPGVRVQGQYADGRETPLMDLAAGARFDAPLANIRFELAEGAAREHPLSYQATEVDPVTGKSMNTATARAGAWIQTGREGTVISGIRLN